MRSISWVSGVAVVVGVGVLVAVVTVCVSVVHIVHMHFSIEARRCFEISYGCHALCFLAYTNLLGKQQFAQHLFLQTSLARMVALGTKVGV